MPEFINRLMQLFKIPFLKRFEAHSRTELATADGFEILRGQKWHFWIKLLALTCLVWIFKYAVLTIIGNGFVLMGLNDHLLGIGKHLIMWVALLVSPAQAMPNGRICVSCILPRLARRLHFCSQFGVAIYYIILT